MIDLICINCWKEFEPNDETWPDRGERIVCPFCGYVGPAPADAASSKSPGGPRKEADDRELEDDQTEVECLPADLLDDLEDEDTEIVDMSDVMEFVRDLYGTPQTKPKAPASPTVSAVVSSGPAEVFISHSSRDKALADGVCAGLEAAGLRCWIAPRDILPGANFAASIIKAIERARVMVVIFSKHTNRSRHVSTEVERAFNKGVAILPFRVEEVVPEGAMEYFLSAHHWLDAWTEPLDSHVAKLAQVAKSLLDMES